MRGSPQKCFISSLQPFRDLTFLAKTITIRIRSLCVVLMISHLVVRRTFYLIVNERDLALNIRLLFSIVIQPLVVNLNDFLQKFKIFFEVTYGIRRTLENTKETS